jgi:hypothetical protein
MKMKREVWAEFADGSIATYGVGEDDLPDLVSQLLGSGVCRGLWVDGQLLTQQDQPEHINNFSAPK